jgi:transcriptional regulator with AAA-type ATPase domain
MTYINIYIPKLSELKQRLEENPKLIEYYIKYEGWSGDSDSINFLEQKAEEFFKNKNKTK